MHLRVDDTVEVIRGDEKGTRGKVMRVDRSAGRIVVEGVNRLYKHVRKSQKNPQGGRLSKEVPINLSNVLLVCQSCNRPTRTGARYLDDGSKERYCKKCGAANGAISFAKPQYAKKP